MYIIVASYGEANYECGPDEETICGSVNEDAIKCFLIDLEMAEQIKREYNEKIRKHYYSNYKDALDLSKKRRNGEITKEQYEKDYLEAGNYNEQLKMDSNLLICAELIKEYGLAQEQLEKILIEEDRYTGTTMRLGIGHRDVVDYKIEEIKEIK